MCCWDLYPGTKFSIKTVLTSTTSTSKSCPNAGRCALAHSPDTGTKHVHVYSHDCAGTSHRAISSVRIYFTVWVRYELITNFIRDLRYNTLFWTRLPPALTSFWNGRFAKEDRTHTVNLILKSAHFLVIFLRALWHDTRRVSVCQKPHSLVFGQDCLYSLYS